MTGRRRLWLAGWRAGLALAPRRLRPHVSYRLAGADASGKVRCSVAPGGPSPDREARQLPL